MRIKKIDLDEIQTSNGVVRTLDGNESNQVEYASHPIDQIDCVSVG